MKPPLMRTGQYWDNMLKTFDGAAAAGAELLSIESVGGKEVHDDALTMCDIGGVIFSLCVMGARDMKFLWDAHRDDRPAARRPFRRRYRLRLRQHRHGAGRAAHDPADLRRRGSRHHCRPVAGGP